jgi:hypothetical protein
LAVGVAGDRQGNGVGRFEAAEGEIEAGDRRFLGDTLPPRILAQPPADFEIARAARAGRVDALEPAEAEQGGVGLALDNP